MLDNAVNVANDGMFADAAKRQILTNALNVIPPKWIVIPISAMQVSSSSNLCLQYQVEILAIRKSLLKKTL